MFGFKNLQNTLELMTDRRSFFIFQKVKPEPWRNLLKYFKKIKTGKIHTNCPR